MDKTIIQKLKRFYRIANIFGFNPLVLIDSIRGIPAYFRDLSIIKKQKGPDNSFVFGPSFLMLGDRYEESGKMSGHYFHQDIFVARRILVNNPERHVDVGSRTDGFVAHVAVFRKIEVLDIRDQESKVRNVSFRQADILHLTDNMINAFDSVSSLHAIEHIGLGRYGDPADYFGHLKAINNISRMLVVGGKFYFSVPIGNQRIEFNAHRIFSVRYLMDLFQRGFILNNFSFVDDVGDLHEDVEMSSDEVAKNFGCQFGCGIFELTKTNDANYLD